MKTLILSLSILTLAACQPVPPQSGSTNSTGPQQNNSRMSPDACGNISSSDVGRKAHAFLLASVELDRASFDLEFTVRNTCKRMAEELMIATGGDTHTLCGRVNEELKASFEVEVSQEQRLVTRVKPSVCTTEVDFAAGIVATCEASIQADVDVRCGGRCTAVCNGRCNGSCSSTGADGSCAGTCDGVCESGCTGSCEGGAYVDAPAECKASAEVRASINTVCTEPEVEVVTENVTVVDATRLARAVKAVQVGIPVLLSVGAKAAIIAKSLVHWSQTAVSLAGASGRLFKDLGARGICVGIQLATAVAASAEISARVEVSIEVSASVSASAGTDSN